MYNINVDIYFSYNKLQKHKTEYLIPATTIRQMPKPCYAHTRCFILREHPQRGKINLSLLAFKGGKASLYFDQ